ncbi:unnamed protein product [Oikopleura dioica]|uniref:Uncharacterized protein n=1 Tax=Oikopleura dioica TaxID=34765 RepID=E4XZB6_OIKDI|nr:unnamed protein product [Oikopleura dioica]
MASDRYARMPRNLFIDFTVFSDFSSSTAIFSIVCGDCFITPFTIRLPSSSISLDKKVHFLPLSRKFIFASVLNTLERFDRNSVSVDPNMHISST